MAAAKTPDDSNSASDTDSTAAIMSTLMLVKPYKVNVSFRSIRARGQSSSKVATIALLHEAGLRVASTLDRHHKLQSDILPELQSRDHVTTTACWVLVWCLTRATVVPC